MRPLFLAAILSLTVPVVAAADTALLLVNDRYSGADNLRQADELLALERPLSAAGFDVIVVENGTADAMRAGAEAVLEAEEDDRILIVVAGHLVHSNRDAWLLASDRSAPNLATVGGRGVALSVLTEIASRVPGRGLVLVGSEPRRVNLGAGLTRGAGSIEAPQGVSVVSGTPDDLADLVRDTVLQPGGDLAAAVARDSGLRSHGFLSTALPFLDPVEAVLPVPDAPGPGDAERALWNAATELDNPGAYRAYLQQYPQGAFVAEARARIAALEIDPQAQAEANEAAMNLTREDRRQIQRALSLLDYDTRGVDGIFGPGTRSAIRGWQGENRYDATGFLTPDQLRRLADQAAVRAAEREEQERLEREARDRADRAYWQATGQGRSEEGLRTYLGRYPDGLFSDIAQARLDEIEADRRAEAEAEERADWDRVLEADEIRAYRRYLDRYPDGLFRDIAVRRIEELRNPGLSGDALARAEAQEAALNLAPVMRALIEQRLAGLGLDPGPTDGRFDAQTRRAISRYQSARGMDPTGYLTQVMVVRLLAEALGARIIE
jgi:peptidoglycan hydrolase-like protein with peptidoglycan-binding domain